jgi:hypothetical protein
MGEEWLEEVNDSDSLPLQPFDLHLKVEEHITLHG